jgi:transcriptional regulator with XRE-family HTH domain
MPEKTQRATDFGEYIKGLREATGRPLRAVAPELGLSYPHLGRIERGEMRGPPSTMVLYRIAAVYERPPEEVLERAGVRLEAVRPKEFPSGEEQFKRLMLAPEWKPAGMKEEYLAFIGPALRPLIRDLVAGVERHTVARLQWEQEHEGEEGSPLRTFAEVIGAATVRTAVDPDWKEDP